MSWFVTALICLLGWGFADIFYKKGSDEEDKLSHLKTAVWVGLVMGVSAFGMLPMCETVSLTDAGAFIHGAVSYLPASLSYIISMVIGYAGLRYLELSVVSPVQNASGAFSAILMLVFFAAKGTITSWSEEFSALDIGGTAAVAVGMIALAVVEQRLSSKELRGDEKKYHKGALALIFPILYCVFDTVGTAADGIILDEETGLGLGEFDVLVIYGLTFFAFGIGSWIYILARTKKPYNPFSKTEWNKAVAAVCEEFGQVFYVFAMAANPVLSAPVVASYCIVSVILSRILLKEKPGRKRYICIGLIIAGIVILGISEAISY